MGWQFIELISSTRPRAQYNNIICNVKLAIVSITAYHVYTYMVYIDPISSYNCAQIVHIIHNRVQYNIIQRDSFGNVNTRLYRNASTFLKTRQMWGCRFFPLFSNKKRERNSILMYVQIYTRTTRYKTLLQLVVTVFGDLSAQRPDVILEK